jgi:hypothetical protein
VECNVDVGASVSPPADGGMEGGREGGRRRFSLAPSLPLSLSPSLSLSLSLSHSLSSSYASARSHAGTYTRVHSTREIINRGPMSGFHSLSLPLARQLGGQLRNAIVFADVLRAKYRASATIRRLPTLPSSTGDENQAGRKRRASRQE